MTRVYIAGAGFIARTHAGAAAAIDRVTDLAVADPDPDAREEFADAVPDATVYEDVDAMLAAPARDQDVVVVATPPFAHREVAVAALESGRHVLCEKPLALTKADARAMRTAAEEADRLLGCCSCRFLGTPSFDRVREIVTGGTLGDLYHVTFVDRSRRSRSGIEYQPESTWMTRRERNGGGCLMDWGPYDATVLAALLDPTAVTVRNGWTAAPTTAVDPTDPAANVEFHAGAALHYDRPDEGAVHVTYERASATHGTERTIFELEGTEGTVRWNWKEDASEIVHTMDVDGEVEAERVATPDPDTPMLHRPLQYFCRSVQGEDAPIPLDGDAVFNFSLLPAIYRAAETDETVTIKRGER